MQYSNLIFVVVLIAAFYFLLIRPQQQQAKRQQQMVESLRPGTQIVTVGGIYATVVTIEEDRVRVAVADGSEIEIARRAVGSVIQNADADEEDAAAAGLGSSEPDDVEEPPVAPLEHAETGETDGDSSDG